VNTFLALVGIPLSALGMTVNHRVAYLTSKVSPEAGASFLRITYGKALKISLVVSLCIVLFSPLVSRYLNLESVVPVLVILPLFLFGLSEAMNNGYFSGTFSFITLGILALLPAMVKIISVLIIRALGHDSLSYLSIPLSVIVPLAFSLLFIGMRLRSVKITEAHQYHFPVPFFLASLLAGISMTGFLTLDIILAKHYFVPIVAGQYALLALIGKMIFYFGSMMGSFVVPFVSRDLGANRNPAKTFDRLFTLITSLVVVMYIVVGVLGYVTVPILFGQKSLAILPLLPIYALAIACITLSQPILTYHLTRRHYVFPIAALMNTAFMIVGISLYHGSIYEIVLVMMVVGGLHLASMIALHFISRHDRFLIRGFVDLISLFTPFPKRHAESREGKRILIFNWRDLKHSFAGGAEVYIHELAKRWVRQGNSVTLFCGNDGHCARHDSIDGVEIIRRGGFYFVYVWAFFYYVFRFRGQYDVIIDCENGIPFFTPIFAREKKFLLIHHVHQEVFLRSLVRPLAMFATFLELRVMPLVYRDIQVITVSNSSKEEILRTGITKVDPIVIHNGIDLAKFIPHEKQERPLILYLGRLKAYKSIHIFIKAAQEVLKRIPHTEFIIAGDGEEKSNLMRLTKKIGIETSINFVGKVTEEEKIRLYQRAWLFVHPSMMEGWSLGIIEANACGTPVVASNVSGLRDSVRNPTTGFLVPYGDEKAFAEKMIQLIRDEKLRSDFSRGAIEWASNFSWDKSAMTCLELFT
jgi:glycosyltransferase involved in cell wall biosynthesis/O-antigen/teichoic acid export membrane protein